MAGRGVILIYAIRDLCERHTGSKLIGRLSILGVEGYGFKSRFPDEDWGEYKYVRINDYIALNGNIGSFDNPKKGNYPFMKSGFRVGCVNINWKCAFMVLFRSGWFVSDSKKFRMNI